MIIAGQGNGYLNWMIEPGFVKEKISKKNLKKTQDR